MVLSRTVQSIVHCVVCGSYRYFDWKGLELFFVNKACVVGVGSSEREYKYQFNFLCSLQ